MQRLEVSGAVRPIYVSLGVKRLMLSLYDGLRHVVTQLLEALRYKPEGRGFDFRWCNNQSIIPLACTGCGDSLPFSGASSIPPCHTLFPATPLRRPFFHPPSLHPAICFLFYTNNKVKYESLTKRHLCLDMVNCMWNKSTISDEVG